MKRLLYLSLILIVFLACSASAFQFYGYTYDTNKTPINNTNVSITAYVFQPGGPPSEILTNWTLTNGSGFFNLSMPDNDSWNYRPAIYHFNGSDADYVGQALPELPLFELQNISPIDFFLKEGASVNITAVGEPESAGTTTKVADNSAPDYGIGLEWADSLWYYMNTSSPTNITLLDPDFSLNSTHYVNLTGIVDFIILNSTTSYFLNSTGFVREFLFNGSDFIINDTFALNGSDFNYSSFSSLGYDGTFFYVVGVRMGDGNTTINKYNFSFDLQDNFLMPDFPAGLVERYGPDWWYLVNEGGQRKIFQCYGESFNFCKNSWNLTTNQVDGFTNNGTGWFYGSSVTSNITEFILDYSVDKEFRYMVKDTSLGYPIEEEFENPVIQATVYLPADRNYSIMVYPEMSFPVSYDLNNLSDYSYPKHVDIEFNTSMQWRWVGGYALESGSANFDELIVIPYLVEPGDMIFQEHPLPHNMSAWRELTDTDRYNLTTGFYNITLPGTVMPCKIMLFAVARKGTDYYGGFRNISLNYSNVSVGNFNFSLYELVGSLSIISLEGEVTRNVTMKKTDIQLNDENGTAITSSAHVETLVDYRGVGGAEFSWMDDVDSQDNGSLQIPLLSGEGVERMNIFCQQYAPQKTSFSSAEVSAGSIEVNMSPPFEPKDPNGEEFMDLFIDMIKSNAACDVPNYNMSACSLFPNASEMNKSGPGFNPFKIVIGGGKISFVMRKASNNITVHYKNVDMLASGPPDALFDDSANASEAGSDLEMAWRFGSQGPEIYDEVLIGIPLGGDVDYAAPISILLKNLYDEDWNVIWNVDVNGTPSVESDLPDDYQDFNLSWFNKTAGGMPCSESDNTAQCYVNNATGIAWLLIPHFSGVGPTVQSVSQGNVTMAASAANYNCTEGCVVYFNITNNNFTLAQSLHNTTVDTLDVNGSLIANTTICWYNSTATAFELQGTNTSTQVDYNLTRYNGSVDTLHRYRLNVTKSANQSATLNITYDITGLSSALQLSLALNCVESWACTDWSACSGDTQSRTCTDGHSCGTTNDRPALSQSCESGGSSGGGGGGGLPTNPSNSQIWDKVTPGAAHIMKIKNDDFGLKEIHIEVNNPANNVKITVTKLPGRPASVTKEITGKVYRYMEINKENLNESNIKGRVKLKFQVTRGWLNNNKLEPDDVVLLRFVNGKWEELKTELLSKDNKYAYYEAEAPGFSYFAITEKGAVPLTPRAVEVEEEALPAEEPVEEEAVVSDVEEAPTGEEPVTEEKKPDYLTPVLTVIILIMVVLVVMIIMKKKKIKELK